MFGIKKKPINEDPQLALFVLEYMGGFADLSHKTVALCVYKQRIEIKHRKESLLMIPKLEIIGVEVDGNESQSTGVTLPRVAVMGVLALGAKKTTVSREAYLTIHLSDDREMVFKNFDPFSKMPSARFKANVSSAFARMK